MKKGHILLLSLFLCIGAFPTFAQGNRSIDQTIYSNRYSTAIDATLVISSNSTLTLPSFTNESQIESGLESSTITLNVNANVNWKVTTEIGAITFAANGDSPSLINSPLTFANFSVATKAPSDSEFEFTPFGINFQAVSRIGNPGNQGVSGNTFDLKLKLTPGFDVDPANYTVPIIMTLSSR